MDSSYLANKMYFIDVKFEFLFNYVYLSRNCILFISVPPVVEMLEPPFNSPLQERVLNQRIAFPCPAKGAVQFYIVSVFIMSER